MAVFRRTQRTDFTRIGAVALSAAIVGAVLSGCTSVDLTANPSSTPSPTSATVPGAATPTPGVSPGPTSDTSPSPEPSATKTADPKPSYSPIDLDCTGLISLDAMYDFNPNFGTDPKYSPASGSLAAKIAGFDGLACGWINQSSGEIIEAAVAHPDAATLTQLKNQAITASNPVPLYGDEGYFRTVNKVGEAQAFSGPYWLVLRSPSFLEPGEAQELVNAAIGSLPGS